ncbi:MAG: ABC transporter permease subunit [Bacteroidetes bacterium]|nr:ABC transporter permease subunit [Bacteroidota bacterium]
MKKSIVGFFALRIPMIFTLLIVAVIVVIIGNFLIVGGGHISWEFLSTEPRNMNTEGGIFPAIYGTVLLVLIMTLAAVPVGTITAIYLTEYARQNSWLARTIRFAVNTLAGVPSIVFGLFGLGFFIQTVGAQIDRVNWNQTMSQFHASLEARQSPVAGGKIATITEVQKYLESSKEYDWKEQISSLSTFPRGTEARVNDDIVMRFMDDKVSLKWGKPGLIWAAFTLALLTLPVVIVSVEESLKTVPKDIRAASLALGATKWETIRKVVIPNSITGILTGSILAIGRGAGEVAPILFTGAVYSLQGLPSSLSDQFMHLGYHLYILSTQSPDVDAVRPLQYATTLVLLALTLALNFTAILLRSHIRRRQITS